MSDAGSALRRLEIKAAELLAEVEALRNQKEVLDQKLNPPH